MTLKVPLVDDASGDFHECLVYSREAFESDAQVAEVVQPCKGALDDPAGFSEATAMRLASTGDLRSDADGMQRLAIFVAIVAAIGLDDRRL